MADIVDKSTRSRMMAGIKGKNTRPELAVRRTLHELGYRFRLHARHLPGHPDIVLPKHMTAIFVHGCFWHRHKNCQLAYTPKSRIDFWNEKFARNIDRDRKHNKELTQMGWTVVTIWECQTRQTKKLKDELEQALLHIHHDQPTLMQ